MLFPLYKIAIILIINMKNIYYLIIIGLCLNLSSCDYARIIPIEFINQTSIPVEVCYSKIRTVYNDDSVSCDTICHKITAGMNMKINFCVWWGGRKTLSKDIPFFEFKTPTRSARFEGPDEVIKIFDKNGKFNDTYKFIISDSLFNCK